MCMKQDPQTHKITDFFSFYSLPSTIINNARYPVLEAAYLYYYASDIAFEPHAEEDGRLTKRLHTLIGDALVIANEAKFDVFNALTLMDNVPILQDLKVRVSLPIAWGLPGSLSDVCDQFGVGDGHLNFYLYNWRTSPLAGMNAEGPVSAGKGVGVVML